jgi:hypothetical protein
MLVKTLTYNTGHALLAQLIRRRPPEDRTRHSCLVNPSPDLLLEDVRMCEVSHEPEVPGPAPAPGFDFPLGRICRGGRSEEGDVLRILRIPHHSRGRQISPPCAVAVLAYTTRHLRRQPTSGGARRTCGIRTRGPRGFPSSDPGAAGLGSGENSRSLML